MATYIGLVHKEEGSAYGVSFPDFPGCITASPTLDEALQRAADVLGSHIRIKKEYGDAIPEPTALERVLGSEEAVGAVIVAVVPNMTVKGKAIRLNITMDEHLVAQIDAHASSVGKTRSAFLADAAREAMQ